MDGPILAPDSHKMTLDLAGLCEQTILRYSQILEQPQFTL